MNENKCKTLNLWPKLSVVIPIRNEENHIKQTIQYIQNQDYPQNMVEILVVDGESDDKSLEIIDEMVKRDNRIKVYQNKKKYLQQHEILVLKKQLERLYFLLMDMYILIIVYY